MRTPTRAMLAVVLMLGTTACLDLDVENQNNPDIERALRDPADVEQVIISSFNTWVNTYSQNDFSRIYSHISDHSTSTNTQRGVLWAEEPRQPFNNDPQGDPVWIPRAPWDAFSACIGNTNDGLRRINGGLVIRTQDIGASEPADNTARAYVFAKLMQGMCLGAVALTNDQIAAAQEDTIIPTGYDNQIEWERTHLKPYNQLAQMATQSLDAAIARAASGAAFTTPPSWINLQPYTNAQLAELANTIAARTLVLSARTPAERAAVDWQKVLSYTAKGLTYDWGPTLQSGLLTSNNWVGLVNLATSSSNSEYRTDYKYIGPADQSGNYQRWLNTNPEDRTPFYISTPDRRVMAAAPTSGCTGAPTTAACSPTGAYFRNRGTVTIFSITRSTHYQSYYGYYKRRNVNYNGGVAFTGETGQWVMASADENRLLRAEALLRTGQVQAAVDLINVTRTRQVRITATPINNLPAIPPTASAATLVPTVNGECVPRKNNGACGDIMDALIWERKMEVHSLDNIMWWAYARGAGLLLPGTLNHMPIPGRYLVSLKLPIYTHGGIGGSGAAQ